MSTRPVTYGPVLAPSTNPTPDAHAPGSVITFGPVEQSATVGDLMRALAQAQAAMENPENDSRNYYGGRYASLPAVRNATIPLLAQQGIATLQFPAYGPGTVACITLLSYGDQYLRSIVQCPVVETINEYVGGQKTSRLLTVEELSHQKYTAVFSYLRRIALKALVVVSDQEDDVDERDDHKVDEKPGTSTRREPARRPAASEARASADQSQEAQRQAWIDEIWTGYKRSIQPLNHAGMHKAIFFHCWELAKPEKITEQPLAVLEGGMKLYRHLTAQLGTWDRAVKPDEWIREQQRQLAGTSTVDLVTGEILPDTLKDMPADWLTDAEQRALEEQEAAEVLAKAEQE